MENLIDAFVIGTFVYLLWVLGLLLLKYVTNPPEDLSGDEP